MDKKRETFEGTLFEVAFEDPQNKETIKFFFLSQKELFEDAVKDAIKWTIDQDDNFKSMTFVGYCDIR